MSNNDNDYLKKLWMDYSESKSKDIKEKLIIQYAPLVKTVAGRVKMYIGNNVDFDDLVSYGIFGLIDAIDKFDYTKGFKFETYASLRIRGEIIDNIRKLDWIPRSLRKKYKELERFTELFEKKFGKSPTDDEICLALDLSKQNLSDLYKNYSILNLVSLDDFVEQSGDKSMASLATYDFYQPEDKFISNETKLSLVDAINSLTEKQRKVMNLYYYEELTLKEISIIMEISESRVSQIHSKCISILRKKLGSDKSLII